jgi:hypothetical protein
MEKIIKTTWEEIWPLANVLNEVCHGINVNDFEKEIGFKYENVFSLLRKIDKYEVTSEEPNVEILLTLNRQELEIIKNSFEEVFRQIEEWEFQTRIGVTIEEANAIKEKIMK